MAKVHVDIKENADGTITCYYEGHKASFMKQPWMSEDEILERVKWELISCGASLQRHSVLKIKST